jgi:hypothetical protein
MMLFRMERSIVFQVFFETSCAITKRLSLTGISFDDLWTSLHWDLQIQGMVDPLSTVAQAQLTGLPSRLWNR